MAMPPSESRSSGSRVPCIGTSVSRWNSSGTAASRGSDATQHSVSPPERAEPDRLAERAVELRGAVAGRKSEALAVRDDDELLVLDDEPVARAPGGGFVPRLAGTKAPRRQSMLNGR